MKTIPVIALACMLMGALTMTSCKKDSTPDETCTNNTVWVANGHQFVYWNEPIYILADSLYINLEESTPGIFKSTSKYDDGTIYPVQSNYIQPCGNSIYQSAVSTMDNRQESWRIDGNIGDNWSSSVTSVGGYTVTTTTTIAAKNVSVTVAAGTFSSCLQLHSVSVSTAPGSSTVDTDVFLDNTAGPVKVLGTSVHYELVRKNY